MKPVHLLLLAAAAVLLNGCSGVRGRSFAEELKLLVTTDSNYVSHLDSIKVDIYGSSVCKMDYFFRLKYDDSSLLGSVYIPLLVSDKPIQFLRFPQSEDSVRSGEFLSVQARSGKNYYLMSYSADDSNHPASFVPKTVHLSCLINVGDVNQSFVNIPTGKGSSKTTLFVYTDSNRELNTTVAESMWSGKDGDSRFLTKLTELPKTYQPNKRTYLSTTRFEPGDILRLYTGTVRVRPYRNLLGAGAIVLFLLVGYFAWEQRRRSLWEEYYRWQRDIKSEYASKEYPDRDAWNLENLKRAKKSWEYGNEEAFLDSMEDRLYREFSAAKFASKLASKEVHVEEMMEMFTKKRELKDIIQKERQLLRTEQIRRIRSGALYLLLLLLCLLLAFFSFAQRVAFKPDATNGSPIIEGLTLTFEPDFNRNSELGVKVNLQFAIGSIAPGMKRETVAIFYDSLFDKSETTDKETIGGNIEIVRELIADGHRKMYQTLVSSKQRKYIPRAVLDLLLTSQLPMSNVTEPGKDDPPYKVIDMNDGFKKVIYLDSSWYNFKHFKFHFHRFPYDEKYIEIPVRWPQLTMLEGITMHKIPDFEGVPEVNVSFSEADEEEAGYLFKADSALVIKANRPCVIKVTLRRNLFMRVILPGILFMWLLISCYWIRTKGKYFALSVAGIDVGIAVIYAIVKDSFLEGVPHLLDLKGQFNVLDVYFVGMVMISILFYIFFRKK